VTAKRVEILREHGRPLKRPRFGYVVAVNTKGGSHFVDVDDPDAWTSKPGEPAFLVSRTADGRSGALWYSHGGIRFTKPPREEVAGLSDDERVALDLILEGGNGPIFSQLVPNQGRRDVVKTIAAQLKTLRSRSR
jgi:hypothetical protein